MIQSFGRNRRSRPSHPPGSSTHIGPPVTSFLSFQKTLRSTVQYETVTPETYLREVRGGRGLSDAPRRFTVCYPPKHGSSVRSWSLLTLSLFFHPLFLTNSGRDEEDFGTRPSSMSWATSSGLVKWYLKKGSTL